MRCNGSILKGNGPASFRGLPAPSQLLADIRDQPVDLPGDALRMILGGEVPSTVDHVQRRRQVLRKTLAICYLLELIGSALDEAGGLPTAPTPLHET